MVAFVHKNVPTVATFIPVTEVSQSLFLCQNCGHSDNADINAAKVLKNRAVKLLKHCEEAVVEARSTLLAR